MEGKERWQEAIIGIVLVAIMLASVFAAMIGSIGAYSNGGEYNIIKKDMGATVQSVLIGQDVIFPVNEGWSLGNVTVYRVKDWAVVWTKSAGDDNILTISGDDWKKEGAFYVNYVSTGATSYTCDAQLSFSDPDMLLKLKVGTKEVSSIAVGTNLTIDTGGINLFPEDVVDLKIIDHDGNQIKTDDNNQTFTGKTLSYLRDHYGDNNLETTGWTIGAYTFQIKTKSEKACGLDATSTVKDLTIQKGEIAIVAETTSTVELTTIRLTVMGVATDKIKVEGDSKNALFKLGVDDTPNTINVTDGEPWFNDTIDSDGVRKYAVEFNDTGSYTIKVTVTGPGTTATNPRINDYDSVDISVSEKGVTFDMPASVTIGEKITIKGTATSGTYVSVYVDDTLWKKLDNLVIEDGEFSKEVKTTDVGMNVPGTVRLKAWIDCRDVCSDCLVPGTAESTKKIPTKTTDGEDAILLTSPELTAELSPTVVALDDDFWVEGIAKGSREVVILSVPPKGGGGKSLLDKGETGLSPRRASVSTTDDTFSKKMWVQEDATTGYYDIYVLSSGMDEEWDMTGEKDLVAALNERYRIDSLTSGIIRTKTQEEIYSILDDMVHCAGSDDLMWLGKVKVETAYVTLNPIAAVGIGEPLVVTGKSNRQEGYPIVVTCEGPVELDPATVKIENGTFTATFDTTDAKVGTYTVKADDGDGHTDEATVEICVFLTRKEAIERLMAEVIQPSPNADMLVAYGLQHPLSASDMLQSLLPVDSLSSTALIGPPYSHDGAWFFWIDDRPQAGYAHTTRFVLIDRATGAVEVTPEEWWPVINDAPCWDTQEIRKSSADIVYEGAHAYESEKTEASDWLAQYISHQFAVLQAADKTKYAILVRGANEGSPEKSVEAMKAQLINIDKFLEGNIKVVKIDKGQKKADPTGKVLKAFEDIVKKIKKDKTEKPKFFFYYVGHANKNTFVFSKKKEKNCEILKYVLSAPYTVVKKDSSLADDSLVSLLLRIPSEDITVIIDACHSSTAIKDLSGWGFKGQILTGANDCGEVRWNYWGLGLTYFTHDLLDGRNKWGSFWEGLHHAAYKSERWILYSDPKPQREKLKGDYKEITISGVIKDKKTGKPIPEATVNLVGISPNGINKISKEDVKVNDKGKYKVSFKLIGYFTIEAKAKGYESKKKSEGLDASNPCLDFSLTRKLPTPTPTLTPPPVVTPTPSEP